MKRLQAILGTRRRWSAGMLSSINFFSKLLRLFGCFAHMVSVEGWVWVVFDDQLNRFARAASVISPASQSARSIPDDTPAAVTILPDRTMRSAGSGLAPKILSTSILYQCVVAGKPFRIPAAPKINAPVQTEVVQVVASCT